MKKFFTISILLTIFSLNNSLKAQWISQATGFTTPNRGIGQICIVDTLIVWAIAIDGSNTFSIIKEFTRTNDGGKTWHPGIITFDSSTKYGTDNIEAFNYDTAFAAMGPSIGKGGMIVKTTDGGITWLTKNSPDFSRSWLDFVHFFNKKDGVCVGDPDSGNFFIYITNNGGNSWTKIPNKNIPTAKSNEIGTNDLFDAVGDTIWFGTSQSRIYRSTDKGLNWSVYNTGFNAGQRITTIFRNSLYGFAKDNNDNLKKTEDGGITWTSLLPYGSKGYPYISFMDYVPGTPSTWIENGYFYGPNGWFTGLVYSQDDNVSYTMIDSVFPLLDIKFIDQKTGWAGGYNTDSLTGGIYKWCSPPPPVITKITQPVSSSDTGSVLLNGLPSTGTWTLTRNPGGIITSGTGNSHTITGLHEGTYTFSVSSTSGCQSLPSANVVISSLKQATLFSASLITNNSMKISWMRGTGTSVLVVARQGSAVNLLPVDGTIYNADSAYGSGPQIGYKNYVIYNGTGSSVNITELASGTDYYFAVYEYTLSKQTYLTPGLTGKASTIGNPPCHYLNYISAKAQNISGNYVDLGTNGSVISTSNFDDANSAPVNIGFTFNYNCQPFTQFVLNTNGFIKLGNQPPSSASVSWGSPSVAYGGIFYSSNPADVNIISPFNHDLKAGTGTPEYRIFTSGVAPRRVCTIQFKNISDKNSSPGTQFDNMEFQIKLYETSNIIEFIYGNWIPSANSSGSNNSDCGLKGSDNNNSQLLTVCKFFPDSWDFVEFFNLPLTITFGNSAKPDPGRTYRFIPSYDSDLTVREIYSMADASVFFSNPQKISTNIINTGTLKMTNIPVILNISGANMLTDTMYISALNQGEDTTLAFHEFTAKNTGITNISVSLPHNSSVLDNTKIWTQNTGNFYCNYSTSKNNGEGRGGSNVGFRSYTKYHINGSANIDSIKVFFQSFRGGDSFFVVVLDSSRNFIGKSNYYISPSGGRRGIFTFSISSPPSMTNSDFYAGFGFKGNGSVGCQYENPVRPHVYFYSNLDGSGFIEENDGVKFMIGAVLSPTPPVVGTFTSIHQICSGNHDTLILKGSIGNIQWQQSPDGLTNWTNVSGGTGANSSIYVSPTLTTNTYYRAMVTQPTFSALFSNVDSVIVNPVYSIKENHRICKGDVYKWHGNNYTMSGTYTANYKSISGCDSDYILHLSVDSVRTSVSVNGNTITVDSAADTYQWLDCNNSYAVMAGDTFRSYTATVDGKYAVKVTKGLCSDTSVCTQINVIGITTFQTEGIAIYPNPVSNELVIEIKGNKEKTGFEIFNSIGKIVFKGNLLERTIVQTSSFMDGIYLIKLENSKSFELIKIVKE